MPDRILPETARRVLERLGFSAPPAVTWEGLDRLYRSWCRLVPFDNARKRLALLARDRSPLPGGLAEDYFEAWLRDGTGGTCWPSSNALYALLKVCGFDARRIAGSMGDRDELNHASVVVRLAGQEYLADASMLTEAVVPVARDEKLEIDDPLHPVRVEPAAAGWLVHWANPTARDTIPCRLGEQAVDHLFCLERYELTRSDSPFNDRLYARRNRERSVLTLDGLTRFAKSPARVERNVLTPEEAADVLRSEWGFSPEFVNRLKESDALV